MASKWLLLALTTLALALLTWHVSWRNTLDHGHSGALGSLSGSLAVCLEKGLVQSLQSLQSPESQAGAARSLHACVRAAITGVSNDSLAASLKRITQAPHIAGTPENMAAAAFVESTFKVPPLSPSSLCRSSQMAS